MTFRSEKIKQFISKPESACYNSYNNYILFTHCQSTSYNNLKNLHPGYIELHSATLNYNQTTITTIKLLITTKQ